LRAGHVGMGLRPGCTGLQPRVHRVEGRRLAEEGADLTLTLTLTLTLVRRTEEGADHPVHRLVFRAETEHAVDEVERDLLRQHGARAHGHGAEEEEDEKQLLRG